MLKQGCTAMKHGRKGTPHLCRFWLSEDDASLCWEDQQRGTAAALATKMAGGKRRSIRLADVVDVIFGAESSVFMRGESMDASEKSLCLSLLLYSADLNAQEQRPSLDVRLRNEIECAQWAAALHALLVVIAADGGAPAASAHERRAAAWQRSAPQIHVDMAEREAALVAAKLAEAEAEGRRWMTTRAEQAMATMAAKEAEAAAMDSLLEECVARQTELRMRLRLLAERDEEKWSVREMKAVLAAGGVHIERVDGRAELRGLTKALAVAAHKQWAREEAEEIQAMQQAAAETAEAEEAADAAEAVMVEEAAVDETAKGTKNLHALMRARRATAASRLAPAPAKPATKANALSGTHNQLALMRARAHRRGKLLHELNVN